MSACWPEPSSTPSRTASSSSAARTLPQVLALAREHDLFVLPTLPGEGVPRVLLEAMASGLPIVVSDVAGVPTLVQHEVNGLLVPPADPAAIAAAIERLIRDGDLRRRADRDWQPRRARPHRRLPRPQDRARPGQDGRHPPAARPREDDG